MGMPNAYKCAICGIVVSFPGTTTGKAALEAHYNSNHSGQLAPADKNAYKCHHTGCNVYKSTVCEMLEHDRATHTRS